MSSVYNPVADLANEEQVYQICLLTAWPPTTSSSDGMVSLISYSGLTQIDDANYAPQETTMDEVEQTQDAISVKLLPVVFSGAKYSQSYTVVAIAIVIEDANYGNIVHHVDVLDAPVTIGPALPDIILYPEAGYIDLSYISNIEWSITA